MENINEYQLWTEKTAIYPSKEAIYYTSLGLSGECGEICNQVKKIIRDDLGNLTEERKEKLIDELGDLSWYLARLSSSIGVPLSHILAKNIEKLEDRLERGKLQGSGDKR